MRPSNIPGHSRQPIDQPFGEKASQEAQEHDGEDSFLGAAIQHDQPGAQDQIGHVAEYHGQQRYGHVPEPLVSRSQPVAAQVIGHARQDLSGGAQAREEGGPEGNSEDDHLRIPVDQEAEEQDGQHCENNGVKAVELEEIGDGPQAVKSGAFDLDLGLINGTRELVLCPIAVKERLR